jgi:predicted transcriptional regulator
MPRRDIVKLVEDLTKSIPTDSTLPITTIAFNANMDSRLAKRLVEMMVWIQSQPKIQKITIGETNGYRQGDSQ